MVGTAASPPIAEINGDLTANGNRFYFDYQDGQYGYNIDPARGADTFSPFKKPIILSQRLIRSGISSSTTIDMAGHCRDTAKVTIDDFLFVTTNINAYCTSWGHPSDKGGPATNNSFSPVSGSYNADTGILTVSISTPTYGSGTYGQTGGGNCKITPSVSVYFLGD